MTNITFITSNKTKLAHARYLCRNYQVNIQHYKKLFYGVGYEEPRINDRMRLLTDSFKDAVRRWREYVSGAEGRLFFIEDTSVKIDAFSDGTNEVPGVDIKYWMLNTDFKSLDVKLREKGNNRKCSVSSHLMLFLTEDLKEKSEIQEDYVIFKSTAYGTIVEKEYNFDTQILYPWLDNRTFNKWFVPSGCSLPISMLNINEAEKGDFRKGAFEQMLSFLEKHGAIKNRVHKYNQLEFQFYNNFVVCGKTCAGKSTIGKFLAEEYGYYHIEASEFMALKLLETHGVPSNIDKHIFASKVLSVEPLFVVNSLMDFLREHGINDRFVITGFRTTEEVNTFFRNFPSDNSHLIYIDSDYKERYRRWGLRQRDIEQYTEDRFRDIDRIQEEMGVGDIKKMEEVLTIDNGTNGLSYFYSSFRNQFLQKMEKDSIKITGTEIKTQKFSLEKAILIILAIEYQKDESRLYTTTEISHLINHYFLTVEKNKNNVSRYFNQSYYVYYEVRFINGKNRYRLSPIGYSEALKIVRNLKRDIKVF